MPEETKEETNVRKRRPSATRRCRNDLIKAVTTRRLQRQCLNLDFEAPDPPEVKAAFTLLITAIKERYKPETIDKALTDVRDKPIIKEVL